MTNITPHGGIPSGAEAPVAAGWLCVGRSVLVSRFGQQARRGSKAATCGQPGCSGVQSAANEQSRRPPWRGRSCCRCGVPWHGCHSRPARRPPGRNPCAFAAAACRRAHRLLPFTLGCHLVALVPLNAIACRHTASLETRSAKPFRDGAGQATQWAPPFAPVGAF